MISVYVMLSFNVHITLAWCDIFVVGLFYLIAYVKLFRTLIFLGIIIFLPNLSLSKLSQPNQNMLYQITKPLCMYILYALLQ